MSVSCQHHWQTAWNIDENCVLFQSVDPHHLRDGVAPRLQDDGLWADVANVPRHHAGQSHRLFYHVGLHIADCSHVTDLFTENLVFSFCVEKRHVSLNRQMIVTKEHQNNVNIHVSNALWDWYLPALVLAITSSNLTVTMAYLIRDQQQIYI